MANEYQIKLRRGTSSNWSSEDPTLAAGEPGYETDTYGLKIGDGSTAYNSLPYVASKYVGELFYRAGSVTSTSASFPAICLDAIDDSATYSESNYPDLIDWARDQRTEYIVPGSSVVDSWTVTVSGSNITFGGADSDTAVLTAIVEEAYYVDAQQTSPSGSPDYTNLAKTINVAGTDYLITGINLGASVVTVTGSPSTGSQTAIFYPHRIAGSSTTARLFQATGMGLMSPGDPDGLFVTGVRRRGYFQGHGVRPSDNLATDVGSPYSRFVSGGPGSSSPGNILGDNANNLFISDGTNGTPRTGPETHGPSLVAHLYMAVGRYVA